METNRRMADFCVTEWRSYSRKQKICAFMLFVLWAYSAYKIYGVLRFGEIFPKSRLGSNEWFSYSENPDRFVFLVFMNSVVVAMPVLLALLILALRHAQKRRACKDENDASDRPLPLK